MSRTARGGAWLAALLAALAGGARPAAAHEGWGVVVDRHGRVYVADIPANIIWRITPGGPAEPVARGIHSHALALGPDGAVYGTHVHPSGSARGVWRLDLAGRLSWVDPGRSLGGMGLQSFLVGDDGALYSGSAFQPDRAPEHRTVHLLRRRADGTIDTLAGGGTGTRDGTGGAAGFGAIDGMAWLGDGRMVVADGGQLRSVEHAGRVRTLGPALSDRRWDEDLLGVAVAPDGTILAADFAGRVLHRWNGSSSRPVYRKHPYWSPAGVVAAGVHVYVLEHPRAPLGILGDLGVGPYLRVRKIAPGGHAEVLHHQWGRNTGVGLALVVAVFTAAGGAGVRLRRRWRGRAFALALHAQP
ncbi:MAG TPA: hypothetical protein VGB24_16765 [Longimicrobium sp.]|uniref:hypothetical protein n=1 Tax=Longimicrobium sp. TaxID=2029185 RepID=UPI002EDB58D7